MNLKSKESECVILLELKASPINSIIPIHFSFSFIFLISFWTSHVSQAICISFVSYSNKNKLSKARFRRLLLPIENKNRLNINNWTDKGILRNTIHLMRKMCETSFRLSIENWNHFLPFFFYAIYLIFFKKKFQHFDYFFRLVRRILNWTSRFSCCLSVLFPVLKFRLNWIEWWTNFISEMFKVIISTTQMVWQMTHFY